MYQTKTNQQKEKSSERRREGGLSTLYSLCGTREQHFFKHFWIVQKYKIKVRAHVK